MHVPNIGKVGTQTFILYFPSLTPLHAIPISVVMQKAQITGEAMDGKRLFICARYSVWNRTAPFIECKGKPIFSFHAKNPEISENSPFRDDALT
jgi:hypothetical protein